jgi:hypothetical protein
VGISTRQLAKHRVSDNVGPCQALSSALLHALKKERHFALLDGVAFPTVGSLVIVFRSGLSPTHASLRSQPLQTQATKSDLILEFREQRLHLSSLPLQVGEGWSVDQASGALPGGLMDMDGEVLVLPSGALLLLRTRPPYRVLTT